MGSISTTKITPTHIKIAMPDSPMPAYEQQTVGAWVALRPF